MIITIIGPTGVGKTRLSLELAKKYNGEIINADSTQVYKEMNIGTAKIMDLEGVPHHLLDIIDVSDEYTVYDYQKEARKAIEELNKKNKRISMLVIYDIPRVFRFHTNIVKQRLLRVCFSFFNIKIAEQFFTNFDENR